jgi:hypothetical protein
MPVCQKGRAIPLLTIGLVPVVKSFNKFQRGMILGKALNACIAGVTVLRLHTETMRFIFIPLKNSG